MISPRFKISSNLGEISVISARSRQSRREGRYLAAISRYLCEISSISARSRLKFCTCTVLPFVRWSQVSTLGFNRCQLGGGVRPENLADQNYFRPQLRLYDPCTRTNVSSSKILAHPCKEACRPLINFQAFICFTLFL